jgi:predicted CopG family antitoxin
MSRRHTITLNDEAFEKIKERGIFGETYSQVIARLAKLSEKEESNSRA